jgi:hypothetical protein
MQMLSNKRPKRRQRLMVEDERAFITGSIILHSSNPRTPKCVFKTMQSGHAPELD